MELNKVKQAVEWSEVVNIKMKIDRNTLLWIIIAILAILVIYVVFFQGSSSQGALSAGQSAGQAAASYGGMVGGC